jgi:hypothetical protein
MEKGTPTMTDSQSKESLEPLHPFEPHEELLDGDAWPRLRLHHLFALTAAMAVLMGISGPQYDFGDESVRVPQFLRVIQVAWGILYSMLAAVAVTVVGYGIAWQRHGVRFFDQPGHWLLVEIAVAAVLGLLPQLAYRAMVGAGGRVDMDVPWFAMMTVGSLSIFLFRVGFNIYIGVKKCVERRWKWVFYLNALAAIMPAFGDLLVLILLSRTSLIDRREGLRRDLLHRCGVSIQLALSLLTVFLTMFFMFSFSLGLWR